MRRSKYTAKLERERELRVIVLLPYIEEIALRRIVVPYPYICFHKDNIQRFGNNEELIKLAALSAEWPDP